MHKVEAVRKLNERELELGLAGTPGSWHDKYRHSSVIYIGGLPLVLTEGDVLTVFEQVGRIIHINMVRDNDTGKSKGFCFVAYEDGRSAILAVDNFNGIKLLERTISVDHVDKYKLPDPDKVSLLNLPSNSHSKAADIAKNSQHAQQNPNGQSYAGTKDAKREKAVLARLMEMRKSRTAEEHARGNACVTNPIELETLGTVNTCNFPTIAREEIAIHRSHDMIDGSKSALSKTTESVSKDEMKRQKLERRKFRRQIRDEREQKRARRQER